MATRTYTKKRFNGGISDDIRRESTSEFGMSRHFDIFAQPSNLVPFRDWEANETVTQKITDYAWDGTDLYGQGVMSGTGRIKLFKKSDTGNPVTSAWTAVTNGEESSASVTAQGAMIYYPRVGNYYGVCTSSGNGYIWEYDKSGTTFTYNKLALSQGTIDTSASVVHPNSNNLYIAYNNVIAVKVKTSALADSALTLPTEMRIVSLVPYGNLMAVFCKNTEDTRNSIVYLWDLDTTLEDITDRLDWGDGQLVAGGLVDGVLVGVSNINPSLGLTSPRPRIAVRAYTGSRVITIQEIDMKPETSTFQATGSHRNVNNRLFFAVDTNLAGTTEAQMNTGIWVIGRRTTDNQIAVTLSHKTPSNCANIKGFFFLGDFVFVSHDDGEIDRTNDQASYSKVSSWEDLIYTGGDIQQKKKLLAISVTTEAMPTAGQVALKYRKDGNYNNDDWITILTDTTDGSIRHSAKNIEGTGVQFPEFNEIQFRIESTGGAVITGYKVIEEDVEDDVID